MKSITQGPYLGWPKLTRESNIQSLLKFRNQDPNKLFEKVHFQGKDQMLPKIAVSLEMPRYRIANRRLKADQVDYQISKKLPKGIFAEKNEENDETQYHQHELLKEVIGSGDQNLENFFKKYNQKDSFILTASGIIVNGNRRICALRELLHKNPKKYRSKKMIDVLILPPCTIQDIDELERDLQYSPNIHQDYTWYAKAYSYAYDNKFYKDTIYNNPKNKKSIDSEIERLRFGERYLRFIKSPNKYKLLKVQEQACETWIDIRSKFTGAYRDYIEFVEKRIFQAMQNPTGGRVYDFIKKFSKVENVKALIIASAKTYRLKEPKSEKAVAKASHVIAEKIKKMTKDESNKDIEQCREQMEEISDSTKRKQQKDEVLILVNKSLAHLHDALSIKNNKSSKKGLRPKLKAICDAATELIKWLK